MAMLFIRPLFGHVQTAAVGAVCVSLQVACQALEINLEQSGSLRRSVP